MHSRDAPQTILFVSVFCIPRGAEASAAALACLYPLHVALSRCLWQLLKQAEMGVHLSVSYSVTCVLFSPCSLVSLTTAEHWLTLLHSLPGAPRRAGTCQGLSVCQVEFIGGNRRLCSEPLDGPCNSELGRSVFFVPSHSCEDEGSEMLGRLLTLRIGWQHLYPDLLSDP